MLVVGDQVLASNRGDNTVVVLKRDGAALAVQAILPCGGSWPRWMGVVDGSVVVTNERSHDVVRFVRRGRKWAEADRFAWPSPTGGAVLGGSNNTILIIADSESKPSIQVTGVTVTDFGGNVLDREPTLIEWDAEAAEKSGYEHYMLKEIYEQPSVLQNTLGGRFAGNGTDVSLDLALDPHDIDRVVVTARRVRRGGGLSPGRRRGLRRRARPQPVGERLRGVDPPGQVQPEEAEAVPGGVPGRTDRAELADRPRERPRPLADA